MQLQDILYSQGFGTRRICAGLVQQGLVTVNGEPCDDSTADFDPTGLWFTVQGKPWPYHEKAYILLHKPAGTECSQKPSTWPSIYTLLPAPLRQRPQKGPVQGVQAVGRLDQDTTGLLLLTDDGQFIHRMSSPRHRPGPDPGERRTAGLRRTPRGEGPARADGRQATCGDRSLAAGAPVAAIAPGGFTEFVGLVEVHRLEACDDDLRYAVPIVDHMAHPGRVGVEGDDELPAIVGVERAERAEHPQLREPAARPDLRIEPGRHFHRDARTHQRRSGTDLHGRVEASVEVEPRCVLGRPEGQVGTRA